MSAWFPTTLLTGDGALFCLAGTADLLEMFGDGDSKPLRLCDERIQLDTLALEILGGCVPLFIRHGADGIANVRPPTASGICRIPRWRSDYLRQQLAG